MKKKIFLLAFSSLLVISGVSLYGSQVTRAQTADNFPVGCTSGLGLSVTSGVPCNGLSTPYMDPLPGCTTALGYSTIDNRPCSGGSVALPYLLGCTSTSGVSAINGWPCDGTTKVLAQSGTPGLPTTGVEGSALTTLWLLLASGILAASGITFFARQTKWS